MKNSLTINLSGIVFTMDEDAYVLLQDYIDSLKKHYKGTEEGDEIIADIEARMAEIFQAQLSDYYEVVTLIDVKAAIVQMGRPEEIFEFDDVEDAEPRDDWNRGEKRSENRKLYRDVDERYLAGVAAGLAHFLELPPLYVRIGFLALHFVFGFGILLYFILWGVLEEATTSAQKLEMRGEKVNLSNIEKTIREEFEAVQHKMEQNFKDFDVDAYAHKAGDIARAIGEGVWTFIRVVFRIVSVASGLIIVLVSTALFTVLVGLLLFPNLPTAGYFTDSQAVNNLLQLLIPGQSIPLTSVAIGAFLGVPIMAFFYFGLTRIFRLRAPHISVIIVASLVWVAGVVQVSRVGAQTGEHFKENVQVNTTAGIVVLPTDTLFLKMDELSFSEAVRNTPLRLNRIRVIEENEAMYGEVYLDVRASDDNAVKLEIYKEAFGKNKQEANKNAQQIAYTWQQNGTTLAFGHYYTMTDCNRWLNQELQVTLRIPVGQVIYLSTSLEPIIHDIKNTTDTWDNDMLGRYWRMETNGLAPYAPTADVVEVVSEAIVDSLVTEPVGENDATNNEAQPDQDVPQSEITKNKELLKQWE